MFTWPKAKESTCAVYSFQHQWLDLSERKRKVLRPWPQHDIGGGVRAPPFHPLLQKKVRKSCGLSKGKRAESFRHQHFSTIHSLFSFPHLPPHSLTEMDKSFTLGHVLSAGAVGLLTGYFFSQSALVSLLYLTIYASISGERSDTNNDNILTISQ